MNAKSGCGFRRINTDRFKLLRIIIFSLVLLLSQVLFAGTRSIPVICPLPLAETEALIVRWLVDSGFTVMQTAVEAGGVRLDAVKGVTNHLRPLLNQGGELKGSESWRIIIRPYSPLASALTAEYTLNGRPDRDKIKELQNLIDDYSGRLYPAKKGPDQDIPEVIISRNRYVVCIRAVINNKPVQFSGFIVGRDGLIISTAHDLAGGREVTVILNNGKELKGRLVKRDPGRDLSLIDTGARLDSSISLASARNILEVGERVYSVGCPYNHRGRIVSGIINGPPGRVNNHPLWQVDMKTLPGGSGSPVFDAHGNLVGVVKGRYRGTESRGFFITMETLIEFLKDLP